MKCRLNYIWLNHQIRCSFPDISYLSETQKNNFQFLNDVHKNFEYLMTKF